ncbi:ADP-ribosylation factor 1-like [Pecten maximus]|uniref:ADP-ribosylation factor 1-like n=1 Tax=Pecten maximus TaxID=6579 RepID=UPI0014587E70|nr:ADP-ribosylation factor 1-like [Pecten maximus]
MGQLATKVCGGGDESFRILMLGLDNAGKTTILYKLRLGEVVSTSPTVGFNVENVTPSKGVAFTMWDIGGQRQIRPLWRHYYGGAQGLIYVVDSSDTERMPEAGEELSSVLESPDMSSCPVVVIANKSDTPNAMKTSQIVDALNLQSLRNRKWHVQTSSAMKGEGIDEAMRELCRLVRGQK